MTNTPKVVPASDAEVWGLEQAILKGYNRPLLTWFRNGGYSSGPDDNPEERISLSSVLARIDSDRARIREQAEENERLKKPKTCFWLDGKICCEERMHSGPDDYCHACGGKVVTGRSDD